MFPEIFFGLTRETNDNICCQRNIRHFCADSVYQVKILLFGYNGGSSVLDTAASGLERKMKMEADLLAVAHCIDQFFREILRM